MKATNKLEPKKTISIPKLELNAALLGARLARAIQEALPASVNRRRFWTDTSTVRNWIRAAAADYQVFVSNRIGEIQTVTEEGEWRFVPGVLNPADAATRSTLEGENFPPIWLNGPEFLLLNEESWPIDLPWLLVKEETRAIGARVTCRLVGHKIKSEQCPCPLQDGWPVFGLREELPIRDLCGRNLSHPEEETTTVYVEYSGSGADSGFWWSPSARWSSRASAAAL